MLAIFIQSSISQIEIPEIIFNWFDKILHFFAFGLLGLLTIRGLKQTDNITLQKNYIWISLLICIVFGASDEIHQLYVAGRSATIADWIADILGILAFSFAYLYWQKRRIMPATSRSENKKF